MQKFKDLPDASVAYNGFEVYRTFLAIKAHFDPETDYDFVKYNGKTRIKNNTLGLKERMLTESIGRKFNREELIEYFVASFLYAPFIRVDCRYLSHFVSDEAANTYLDWKKDKFNYSYILRDELSVISDAMFLSKASFNDMFKSSFGSMPPVVNMAIKKHIRPYTLVVFESLLGFMSRADKKINDPILWPSIKSTIQKTVPFYTNGNEHRDAIRKYMETL